MPIFKNINIISFDAAGTLFHPFPSVGFHYAAIARQFGLPADAEVLEARFRNVFHARGGLASLENRSSEAAERQWWKETVAMVFNDLGTLKDSAAFFEALYVRFASKEAWRVYPDVHPVLRQLHQKGFRLCVLSNWDSRLLTLLASLGLNSFFTAVVFSSRAGAAKPNRHIFNELVKMSAVRPQEILHVGDHFLCDVEGALAAGFSAVYLDRKGQDEPWSGQTITSLDRLVELV